MDLSYILNELGEDREAYFNAVAPPIIQASNFSFKKVADLSKAFEDESICHETSGYLYSRGQNPTVEILRKKLAALDQAEDALVVNSGASAIFAGVLANVKAGDHIVSIRNPYTWAWKLFDDILSRFGITTTYIDGSSIENWKAATQPNTSFYYLESPNSWDFVLQPIEEVASFAKSRGIITMIDNSYCTSIYQPVIPLGIDIAMQTATKFISGHSDTLGGVLSGTKQMMRKIFNSEYLAIGSGIQPFNAWLLLRGLRTLPIRLTRIHESTIVVHRFLKSHQEIESIIFPFDESFPQYKLAKKQMGGAGGLLTIIFKTRSRAAIVNFCESLKHILMAVSWGGHESLVIPKCASLPSDGFDPANKLHRSVRLYIGLEEPDYIIADLAQAIDNMHKL